MRIKHMFMGNKMIENLAGYLASGGREGARFVFCSGGGQNLKLYHCTLSRICSMLYG